MSNSQGKRTVLSVKDYEETEEETRQRYLRVWMNVIACVFQKAEPLFKKMREKVNEMYLKLVEPKAREFGPEPGAANKSIIVLQFGSQGRLGCHSS